MLWRIIRRLEAAEQAIAELRAAAGGTPLPSGEGQEDKPSGFKLDDAKLQEGIANLMGYDPLCRKRGEM